MAQRSKRILTMVGAAFALWRVAHRLRARASRTLRGRVAIVTGGSRGLGFLLAGELGRQGCRVVICARDGNELERARASLAAGGVEALAVACDVSDPAAVDRLVATTLERFGQIDLLINNAGTIHVAPLEALGLADFHDAMSGAFWGTVHTSLAVLPHMRARGSGRIVNVTSIGGKVAVPHLMPYACAKFAAVGFSDGLRAEVARDGIKVTTVIPGLMRTGSSKFALFKGRVRAEHAWFGAAAHTPGLAMSARRAARRIVAAAKRGDAQLVLGAPAKALRLANDLLPGLTARSLSLANRLLPRPDRAPA
jgi:NAD(P)-dependent dehydrogenase (short-subunit alcohol dehydrogenase family)